ncbi:iron chelate uptake ABC transporter permease subunit VctG [Vibrio sp. ZSDE26]|uniref:Iron chelate uptake ABC transporter permease subunit VctG n=1 Tax=Vibrio amylolyticus TaxID=2847292 RepID=A0A9X1XNJ8_9VIBR|nr:iron chelate uptake ABC transporter family permease subunit [Vibrio amylolyticus]MCK6265856.1 iron chelate uptake ABC transporter permease subunit VctG [Vibrio amylolyticus]
MQDRTKLILLILFCVLFAGLFIGLGLTADNYQYFLSRRVPKVVAMVLAGVAIAQSSLAFQTITNNRILTPSIMGFDSLYMLTQVFVIAMFGGFSVLVLNAYVNFALSVVIMLGFSLLLFSFYFRSERHNLIALLLLGVILGQLFSNISSFLIMLMDPNDFASVQSSMFASFNNIKVELVYPCVPLLSLVCVSLYRMHYQLDVFWLDKDNAISLGVDVRKVTMRVLVLSAVLIAISTALIGPIMFFGILVTNLTRELFHTYKHSVLLVACSLSAVGALLSGQWVVENVFSFSTTLSVVINFIGGIYFLSMLLRNKVT